MLPPLLASLGGLFVRAGTVFALFSLPKILLSIGFSFVAYKGLDKLLQVVVSNIHQANLVSSVTFYGQSIDLLGFVAACGIFDALNIVLSGYSSLAVWIMGSKVLKFIGPQS